MLSRWVFTLALLLAAVCAASGQESPYGVSVPVTIAGNALYTNAKQTDDGVTRTAAAGFRAVASPVLRLGPHWFLYARFDLYSSSYFTGSSYSSYDEHSVDFETMEAFVGYSVKAGQSTLLLKAGQMSSAFGLAPVEYDDLRMPLLAPPSIYTSRVNLRPDQIPCGTAEMLGQRTGYEIEFDCGGGWTDRYGIAPVTLDGIPAVEAELSTHRVDARLQITNSSPANPQGLRSDSQFAQWTAGAGYTFKNGLHLGVSGFRGPYLDQTVEATLPPGGNIRELNATGIGADLQWSRGAWSTEGEWQRFRFEIPGFTVSPSVDAGYGQVKRILSPRAYVAARISFERFGRVVDSARVAAEHFQPPLDTYEIGAGYRLNRRQLIKAGFSLANGNLGDEQNASLGHLHGTVEIQLVSEVTAISHAFR